MPARLISEQNDRAIVALSEDASFHYRTLELRQKIAAFGPDVIALQSCENGVFVEDNQPDCFYLTHEEMVDLILSYQAYLVNHETALAASREYDDHPF